ncbi:MAG: sensor histidine kinase, partial [Piscinibacter sp.]
MPCTALLRTLARCALVALLAWSGATSAAPPSTQLITQALAVAGSAERFPEGDPAAITVALPDDWSETNPRQDGGVWYRVEFDPGHALDRNDLLGLYVHRACSARDVYLIGRRIHCGGRPAGSLARDCHS